MTGRDMFGNKISEEQRKASLLQALGIAGAGALSTKVAGKTAKAGANAMANGAKKLSDMRNSLRTEVITNRARSAYQSVQKSSPSWTQSLKKTYNNILDSNMPRLMPELAPLGPDLGQRTVRETLQNSKNYVMQKAEKVSAVSKVTSEVTPKKKSLPDWLKDRWQAGNNFNKENRPRYPYNEVELEAKEVGGKKYVVDSYAPNKEIVSRKFTQLSEVQEKTAKSYLNEITKKYSSGSKISNSTFNPNALKGGRLKGELILEVPVQNKTIPQTILDEATKNRIVIRDIKGKVYN